MKAAKALLDPDLLKLDDEGKAPDLSEQIKALQESDGYLFDEGVKAITSHLTVRRVHLI